ncbi:hypothetical protein LRS05_07085 [Flavobacterium sp. J372]|uniref:hypothetical protein n=1 Tax=Flavobacterium sp. J372 TaxID=2898436 RepID=UPI00215177D0|nr:hypothetical protein [Flavobacterium sp. J372]MCR5861913.1 hypothetical protein [Flavobacterium sp. J372]
MVILLVLLPFLPGPGFLSGLTNIIFSLAQISSFLGLILVPVGFIWLFVEVQKKEKIKTLPILMCTVPVLAFVFSFWISDYARDYSRTFAINNAENLIKAIEKYNYVNKHYPYSLAQLAPKYVNSISKPWVMGISGYDYKKNDDGFNLSFTQDVLLGFNYEVVVFDSNGNHKAEGELTTLYPTENRNWKYYIYD